MVFLAEFFERGTAEIKILSIERSGEFLPMPELDSFIVVFPANAHSKFAMFALGFIGIHGCNIVERGERGFCPVGSRSA